MSRHVSNLDKFIRILTFSLALSLVVAFAAWYFYFDVYVVPVFFISLIYFFVLFVILTMTENIHYPILIKRENIKNVLYESHYHPSHHIATRIVFAAESVLFLLLFFIFISMYAFTHAVGLVVIWLLSLAYFYKHKVRYCLTKEGVVFDYGIVTTLILWDEIRNYSVKGHFVVLHLKYKEINRKLWVSDVKLFEKAIKKFVKQA